MSNIHHSVPKELPKPPKLKVKSIYDRKKYLRKEIDELQKEVDEKSNQLNFFIVCLVIAIVYGIVVTIVANCK